jgi:hypothetical protein
LFVFSFLLFRADEQVVIDNKVIPPTNKRASVAMLLVIGSLGVFPSSCHASKTAFEAFEERLHAGQWWIDELHEYDRAALGSRQLARWRKTRSRSRYERSVMRASLFTVGTARKTGCSFSTTTTGENSSNYSVSSPAQSSKQLSDTVEIKVSSSRVHERILQLDARPL